MSPRAAGDPRFVLMMIVALGSIAPPLLVRSRRRARGAEATIAAASRTLPARPRVDLESSDLEVETGGESSNLRLPAVRPKPVGLFDDKAYYHLGNLFGISVSAMDLDRSFGFLVHDVARLFARRFNQRALLFLGLTRAQCKVLGYLARNEGINQAGLADLLEIKPMTLVRQIDRMEEDGWIERRPDPGDRRARRLVLTEKARPILSRILDLSNEVRTQAFAGLSEVEGRHLISLLGRVHGNLSERVPPFADAELSDLDEPHDHAALGAAVASADLSSVGVQR